ncbi:xanthine dehydrogenase family protein molybdopterin-binding subunit [Halotalea alkalilenta]|uniref:Aldehyde oxidase n=1 Tax=Halotalea alkalilenta TaxID=376489 RepID=A0A172YCR6_9GAMM|nr:xanthine dehydrogenase family protein molybdopterin-binding subunit [Halotalea alkalilenta]ANF56892.1 aldehyde oxidase [Halotalea alkalilenta]
MTVEVLNQRTARIDGELKVSGGADYAGDHQLPGMLHGYPVVSPVASGRLERLDFDAAMGAPGVVEIIHGGNFPRLNRSPDSMAEENKVGEVRLPFEDDQLHYHGQYLALVVADSFEHARAAALLVSIEFSCAPAVAGLSSAGEGREMDDEAVTLGEPERALVAAEVRIDAEYRIATEAHAVMETHATLASWQDDRLTVYESTQGVVFHRNALAQVFAMAPEQVEVIAHYIGSGFGSKLFMWPHSVITCVAARRLGRPVRTVLPRQWNFANTGHRPASLQRLRLGADRAGKLQAILHDALNETSPVEAYSDSCASATPSMYACDHVAVTQRIAEVNHGTPTSMRAPGEASGNFALETALDELAVELGVCPVELRRRNFTARDLASGLPWSSNHLLECFDDAARRFGWERRDPVPRSMRDGHELIGYGMATQSWSAMRKHCTARASFLADGRLSIATGTQDIGTGTYTIVAQTASQLSGVPLDRVEVKLGDSQLPTGPLSGGSMATASTLPAVAGAVREAIATLERLSIGEGGRFEGAASSALEFRDGRLWHGAESASVAELLQTLERGSVDAVVSTAPGDEQKRASFRSFGAVFVEVRWDPGISRLRVARVVSTIDGGRMINPLTAHNQLEGGIVMGLGMALFERLEYERDGRLHNHNFADYIVPVHADMPEIELVTLDYPDLAFNEFGARGVGEIGLTGVGAAVSNAVFHATGKRIRELPIRLEALLEQ